MANAKDLRNAIVEARAGLQGVFHDAHGAWERRPQAGSEGEDAWSPRQVAEHVIGAEVFFASMVSQACGAPAIERPQYDVSTPAAAAASLTRLGAIADNVLRHVRDGDLAKTYTSRMGEMSVEKMMEIIVSHARDHANQIRNAAT